MPDGHRATNGIRWPPSKAVFLKPRNIPAERCPFWPGHRAVIARENEQGPVQQPPLFERGTDLAHAPVDKNVHVTAGSLRALALDEIGRKPRVVRGRECEVQEKRFRLPRTVSRVEEARRLPNEREVHVLRFPSRAHEAGEEAGQGVEVLRAAHAGDLDETVIPDVAVRGIRGATARGSEEGVETERQRTAFQGSGEIHFVLGLREPPAAATVQQAEMPLPDAACAVALPAEHRSDCQPRWLDQRRLVGHDKGIAVRSPP